MPLKTKNINKILDRYFNGEMTGLEMNQLEKQALSDSFLKDAMDGYAENAGGLKYFNRNVSKSFRASGKMWLIGGLSVALLIMTGLYFTKTSVEPDTLTVQKAKPLTKEDQPVMEMQAAEIEVIPAEIKSMHIIDKKSQIQTKHIKDDFLVNQTYHSTDTVESDYIELIDPNQLIFEEETPQIIVAKKANKKVVYPYRYFYDMAVVDYGRFDDREKIINKTVYRFNLSGLDASFESDSAKHNQELIEQTIEVGYLDYLEETLYYFSKERYKNALKRIHIISSQYKNDLNALFYGGLCYFNLGDFNKAIESFENILKLKEGPFTEEAQWYKVKTLLKLNRQKEAKDLLADIIMFDGFYKAQASELLKKLNA